MDTVCNKKRVQDSISCPSQIDKGSASVFESNTLRSREDSTSTDRSKIYAGQTCHRTSFLLPSKGWLLQQALSGSQEVGRMETSNRSVPTKSACNHSSFQDGNFRLGSSFFTEARLGHFPRLDRCILSYTNSSQVKEVSSFSLHGENIPVSSFAVRPGSSSLRVLQNCEGSGQTLSSHGHASTFLSRRLAPAVSISSDVFVSQRSTTEHGFVPGICSQLGQIRASSQSEVFFSGSTFLSRGGTDRPFFGQVNKTGNLDSENAVSSISISQTDSFSSWSNGVYGSSPARWQSPQAYASVVHQGPLVSSGPVLGFSHFPRSLVQQGCNPMAEQGLPVYHGATVSAPTRLVSIHGCESGGLGCPYGRSLSLRPMVCLLADSTHKCPGTQSSHVGSEILPSDNSELSYSAVNRQYDCSGLSEQRRGARSRTLSFMATNLLEWCMKRQVSLTAKFVPGKLNVLADSLSRKGQIIHTEWTIHKGTLSQIFQFWEVPHLDLFATRLNNQLPVFISPFQDPRAWAVDAMSLSWEGMIAYAFPPVPLLMKVLLKMEKETCLVILIAPCWESHPFFPVLLSLLVAPAVRIPIRKDLLIQPHSRLPHPKPEIYNLHAWLCCREVSRRQDFLRNLPRESVLRSDLQHSLCTIPAGTLGWIGVSSGRWIPSIQL